MLSSYYVKKIRKKCFSSTKKNIKYEQRFSFHITALYHAPLIIHFFNHSNISVSYKLTQYLLISLLKQYFYQVVKILFKLIFLKVFKWLKLGLCKFKHYIRIKKSVPYYLYICSCLFLDLYDVYSEKISDRKYFVWVRLPVLPYYVYYSKFAQPPLKSS